MAFPLFYAKSAYKRSNGQLPELRLVNMWVEATPTASEGLAIMSRPGLDPLAYAAPGPIRALFQQADVFNGDRFTISGNRLYRRGLYKGTIDGDGPVSIAVCNLDANWEILFAAGGSLWSYKATGLERVAFPDDAFVTAVAFISGHFVAARAGTHNFYWSGVEDGRSWDALDFASAESNADELVDVRTLRGNLYLIGRSTVERWAYTGALALPFQLIGQTLETKGAYGTGCTVELDNTLIRVGSDGMVYRTGDGVAQRISDHGIEERISQASRVSAFGFVYQGHSFFCLRLFRSVSEQLTFGYDAATGEWCEFQTHGHPNFRACCAVTDGDTVLLGDDAVGTIWTFGGWVDGDAPLLRLFTAAFPLRGGAETVDNLNIEVNVGWTGALAGQGSDPVAEMRSSRDGGHTWGSWRSAPLGQQGYYRTRTQWRRCGMFDAPGGMFEFRCVDPVPFRVTSVTANEQGGGRARPTPPAISRDIIADDPAYLAVLAQMEEMPRASRRAAMKALIADLKAAGAWVKFDYLFIHAAHAEQAALVDWIGAQPGGHQDTEGAGKIGSPTFTVDRGFLGNGEAAHITTATSWPASDNPDDYLYKLNDAHAGCYVIEATADTGNDVGALASVNFRIADTPGWKLNTQFSTFEPAGTGRHYMLVTRTAADSQTLYLDGAVGVTNSAASTLKGSIDWARNPTRTCAVFHGGGSLTRAEANATYEAFRSYLQAIGTHVP